ncbi:SGNH/GDSL hydrolase family protein [Virgibacillus salexigens]|uniref:SGNH/GDSL hydrolase family protein n=1 Tax=Virgibacillus salexigens TaxID=61016 RepID=UPI00190C78B6|nr:SGNH/GDSL hydrolase family protein [Virgibacillus salexigens]
MKKNVYYLGAICLLLLGITLIFIVTSQSKAKLDHVTIPEEKEDEHQKQPDTSLQNDEQTNKETTNEDQQHFSEMVVNAVEETINYFSNKTHITAIGDSLTQGVGDTTQTGGYLGVLDRAINQDEELVSIDNYGIRGNRSDQLLKRLDNPDIVSSIKDSNIVLITIGANDIMQVLKDNITNLKLEDFVKERADYEQRLRNIFAKIHDINPRTEIYLLGFYNPFGKYFKDIKELGLIVKNWNDTGEKIAAEQSNVSFIPTIDLFNNTNEDLFAEDNFHPNNLGYKRMAQRVLDFITNEDKKEDE